ncbi:ABC transporter substrate-binding protein [Candidatus Poriferisodalis sp.]|uniref:ABC transporter substrate-binding protein n=1 Tax=Candidatus Poriferisodalis sp. TaxID=3101277 RepID=UPI003B02BF3E
MHTGPLQRDAQHPTSRCLRRSRRSLGIRLGVILAVFALIAAACGGGDDDESGEAPAPDPDTSEESEAAPATTVPEEMEEVVEAREAGEATGEDVRETETGPVHGGKLVYGIEADSANPFVHYATSCAISCRMIFRAITDSLYITDADGDIVPYLVESESHSDDYMEWTMTIRDGITFHDGTPLTGEAVAYNINLCRLSQLTGPAFLGIANVVGEGQTVTVTASPGQPLATGLGPAGRAEVCGQMFSQAWMETLPNNPLYVSPASPLPETARTAAIENATGNPSAPIGLGAFRYVSYAPGNGNSFVAERNPDYWRGPNGVTGENLPYLDEIEFVVAVDIQGRSNGLKAGQFDIIHTANADEIAKYEGDSDFVLLQANDFGETSHSLINVASGVNPVLTFVRGGYDADGDGQPDEGEFWPMDPLGLNSTNPLVHLSCRKAMAHAFDGERYANERHQGLVQVANGPFPPGSVGYLEESGFPSYDLDAARAEFEQCKADSGQNPVTFSFNTTNDAFNVESNELIASMWTEAFGDELAVSIAPIEQGQYIGLALAGVFQMQGWRNHGGVDPSEQWYWWNSATASPVNPQVPELALNFGRFQDPEIDAAFQVIRHNPDPAARKAAAEAVNRAFGKNVWNLWTYWTLWGVIANPRVQNITSLPIPDNAENSFPVIAGKHHLGQIWCTDGDCQG